MPDKKNHAWSYSSINVFAQCPRRWFGEKIQGFKEEEVSEALIFGIKAHKEAELYGKEGTPFSDEFRFMEKFVKPLIESDGRKEYELRLALTSKLEPCGFFDSDCWWRGIADFVSLKPEEDPTEAVLVDYKTGKSSQYADIKQLELLSLGLFNTYPSLQVVKGALVFVVLDKDNVVGSTFKRESMEKYWSYWDKLVADLQFALVQGEVGFPKKKNALCKSFCPVVSCNLNGKFEG